MEMTVQLRIDGRPCDLGPGPCAVPGYSAARTSDPDACREGRRMQLAIPPTPRNRTLLGDPRDPQTGSRFNAAFTRHHSFIGEIHPFYRSLQHFSLFHPPFRLLPAAYFNP